jgi:thymidylate synthase
MGGFMMKPANLFGLVVAVSFAVTLAWGQPLIAQTQQDEVSQLRQKNMELENRVKELEALLKECVEAKKNQFPEDRGWENKKNWRSLESGMNEDQVKKILGEPVKVIKGVKTLWYYPNLYGGYVSFDDKGRLVGWNEP